MSNKKIDLEKTKNFVEKICIDSSSKPNSLKVTQLRNYLNNSWDDLTDSAIKFLSQCITVLENQREEVATKIKITELLKNKSF